MNLDTLTCSGLAPWHPSQQVRSCDPWALYDVPTLGVLDYSEGPVLFVCLLGADDRFGVWAYLPLREGEDDVSFDSDDELWRYVETLFNGRAVILRSSTDLLLDEQYYEMDSASGMYGTCAKFLDWELAGLRAKLAEVQDDPARSKSERGRSLWQVSPLAEPDISARIVQVAQQRDCLPL